MILVFGSTGQIAEELKQVLPDARFLARGDADLASPASCAAAIGTFKPAAVINAAGYTAVDLAEKEEGVAATINGDAPGAMARACAGLGIPLVHISTDYVFDGAGTRPFAADDRTAPLNAYGRSKVLGEELVRESGASHAIVRTSWVFSRHGHNFVKAMLALSHRHASVPVVEDQMGGPTPASAIANACWVIAERLQIEPELSGTYHFTGAPDVSRADFARTIFTLSERNVVVEGISSEQFGALAQRPLNGRLDCGRLEKFGLARPRWRGTLADMIQTMENP